MKYISKINVVILVLLGSTAGFAKILQEPEEVKFFESVGFSVNMLVGLGVFQMAAAFLIIFKVTRIGGAGIMMATLLISSVSIFASGNIWFGLISLLPALLCYFVIRDTLWPRQIVNES